MPPRSSCPRAKSTGCEAQAALATAQAEEDKEAFQAEYPIRKLKFDYAFEKDKKPFLVSAIYHDDKFTYIRSSAGKSRCCTR